MTPCMLTFDIEDWFQVENLRAIFPPHTWEAMPRRVAIGTRTILQLLERYQIRATFFILGWVADREPMLVKEIAAAGHEIACHGYGHIMPLQLTTAAFREDLLRARKTLEDISGSPVVGYRAPSFNIDHDRLAIVAECGFQYDSSHHPFAVHERYGRLGRLPAADATGVRRLSASLVEVELPVEQAGPLALPASGGAYFRIYPGPMFRALARRAIQRRGQYTMYLHSWEFDAAQPRVRGIAMSRRFRHYTGLRRTAARFEKLILMFRRADRPFITVSEFVQGRAH
jgi:polysaccharide deacetylase family protein (PEP-CTERM system associated)